MPGSQTLGGAYQKIEGHEALCTERHKTIDGKLDELKAGVAAQNKMQLGVLLAVVGWMALQLWDDHTKPQPSPPAPAVAALHP